MDNSLRNALVFAILPAVAVVIGGVTFFYKPPTFIHPHRINSVTDALRDSGLWRHQRGGCYNITVSNVQRLYTSAEAEQQRFSVELVEPVLAERKLKLICEDGLADQLAALIAQAGKPGPGWVFVSDIQSATKIT